jgi:hypothetical protein
LPPDIDVYVQLPERDERVLVGFLDEYMPDWRTADRWLEAKPPQDAIARGLEGSTEEFALYGRVDTMPGVDFAVVAFPADGSLVLGLSVDGEDEERGKALAESLLERLFGQVNARRGVAIWEEPPLSWAAQSDWGSERVYASRP